MTWGFVWLMFILKIPILMLLGIVWWAIKAETNPAGDEGNGGIRRHREPPFPRWPKPRRRGPRVARPPRRTAERRSAPGATRCETPPR